MTLYIFHSRQLAPSPHRPDLVSRARTSRTLQRCHPSGSIQAAEPLTRVPVNSLDEKSTSGRKMQLECPSASWPPWHLCSLAYSSPLWKQLSKPRKQRLSWGLGHSQWSETKGGMGKEISKRHFFWINLHSMSLLVLIFFLNVSFREMVF